MILRRCYHKPRSQVEKMKDEFGLKQNLSARRKTGDAELLKLGKSCNMAIASQAPKGEGVETRRAAPDNRNVFGAR